MKEKRDTLHVEVGSLHEVLAGAQGEHAGCADRIAELEGERDAANEKVGEVEGERNAAVEAHAGCDGAFAEA